jgi:hypothetical protein
MPMCYRPGSHRTRNCGLLLLAATFLLFADVSSWKTKAVEQWDNEDAKQLLADSPWVGSATLQPIPDRSPGERRDSGDWDTAIGPGVGIAGTGILGPRRMAEAIAHAHEQPSPGKVAIRWESAMPVRAAESKLGEAPASVLYTGWYAITLYDVPLPQKHWGATKLKGLAWLRREHKPDFKPSRVEVHRQADGMATLIYLFPRREEITRGDKNVIFAAQIDRLFISEVFYPGTMQIAGKLEL